MTFYKLYVCILKLKKRHVVKFLRVNKIASVLEGLDVTSHCLAHCDKSIKSCFMRPWISSRLDESIKKNCHQQIALSNLGEN